MLPLLFTADGGITRNRLTQHQGTVQLPLIINGSQQGVQTQPVATKPSITTAPTSIPLTFTNDYQASLNPFATITPPTVTQQTSTVAVTSTTTVSPTSYPNLSRLGQSLEQLFEAFEQGGITSADAVAQHDNLAVQGDSVSVNVRTNGNFSQLSSELDGLGMQSQTSLPYIEDVSGLIPISQLGNLSNLTDATYINPVTATPVQSQGSSTGFTLH